MSPFSRRAVSAALFVIAAVFLTRPAAAQSDVTARLDSVMNTLMALDVTPGMGIVVVRDTQIVYMKGFGYADIDAKRPFTPQTEFYIASTTKSFTGLAAALLDKKGTFKLDAPLHQYLPALKLQAPMDADSITIRSLLTHTHGIGGGPVAIRLAYSGEYKDDAELLRLLEMHSAAKSGRAYSYTNLGYNVATLAMDRVTKKFWKDILAQEIFTPLGMKNTSAYVSKFKREDLATPYGITLAGWTARPYGKTDANMQSAGGLITTLRDMGTWLEANINDGRINGRQVLPASAFETAHTNYIPMATNSRGAKQIGYGLGWEIVVFGNDTVMIHGGGFPGFATSMSYIPSRHIGVAVFANNDWIGGGFVDVAAQEAYSVLTNGAFQAPPMDQIPQVVTRVRGQIKSELERRAARSQVLPFPLEAYAGTYENPAMGHLRIEVVNGKLEARFGAAWSAIEVFDATKNQLRIELFGNGEIVNVEMKDGKAAALSFGGNEYRRRD
jgi:CubicO group peptidase (beta-lactamase class C family)